MTFLRKVSRSPEFVGTFLGILLFALPVLLWLLILRWFERSELKGYLIDWLPFWACFLILSLTVFLLLLVPFYRHLGTRLALVCFLLVIVFLTILSVPVARLPWWVSVSGLGVGTFGYLLARHLSARMVSSRKTEKFETIEGP